MNAGCIMEITFMHSTASISGQPLDIRVAGQQKDIVLTLPFAEQLIWLKSWSIKKVAASV